MASWSSVKRKLRALAALPWRDRWLLFQAWVLLLVVDLALRTLPFPWIGALAARGSRKRISRSPDENAVIVRRLRRLTDLAARHHLYPMRCLRRSLALQWLLNRCGIPAVLRLGVQREAGTLKAHAWLEHDGLPIGEPQDVESRFVPLLAREASL
jgi:hypothetical protein